MFEHVKFMKNRSKRIHINDENEVKFANEDNEFVRIEKKKSVALNYSDVE